MSLRKFRGASQSAFRALKTSYVERLYLLHMPRLEMRRIQNDLIFTAKQMKIYLKYFLVIKILYCNILNIEMFDYI